MLRTQITKLTRASSTLPIRTFTTTILRSAEGDIGGVRSGGSAASDSFNKREQASENKFIRDREREALKLLKEKLQAQRKHLDELDNHIQDMEKNSGGEHN